jgi:hypothetical protein
MEQLEKTLISPFDDGYFWPNNFATKGLETTRAKTPSLGIGFHFAFGGSEFITRIEGTGELFSGKHAVDSIDICDNIFIHGGVLCLGLDASFLFLECQGCGDFLLFKVFGLAKGLGD